MTMTVSEAGRKGALALHAKRTPEQRRAAMAHARKHVKNTFTPEHIARMVELRATGLSYAKITAALVEEFGRTFALANVFRTINRAEASQKGDVGVC